MLVRGIVVVPVVLGTFTVPPEATGFRDVTLVQVEPLSELTKSRYPGITSAEDALRNLRMPYPTRIAEIAAEVLLVSRS